MAKDPRLYGKFTLDFADNYKILPLSDSAFRCLVEATLWSRQQMSDGVLARRYAVARWGLDALTELATNDQEKPSLIETEDGWLIRDFAEHQDTRAEIEARSTRNKAAGRRGGQAKAKRAAKQVASESLSESLPETETETETNSGCVSAAASPSVTRTTAQRRQRETSTHFGDGVPVGEPPPDDEPEPHPKAGPAPIVHASTAVARTTPSTSAATLVRLHIPNGIPRTIQKQLAAEVDKLARDRNVDRADIDAGLQAWARRPDAGPRLLPNLVADAARQRTTASKPVGVGKPSEKAASIHAAGQALLDEIRRTS